MLCGAAMTNCGAPRSTSRRRAQVYRDVQAADGGGHGWTHSRRFGNVREAAVAHDRLANAE